jgi:hypothetical protein
VNVPSASVDIIVTEGYWGQKVWFFRGSRRSERCWSSCMEFFGSTILTSLLNAKFFYSGITVDIEVSRGEMIIFPINNLELIVTCFHLCEVNTC